MEQVPTHLTKICKAAVSDGDYKTAVFFAEKALSLMRRSKKGAIDVKKQVFLLAKCYKLTEQYERASGLLEREGLLQKGTEVKS